MKSSGIGGQAVLEGVMMKNKNKYAVAVRKPDGEIEVQTSRCKGAADRSVFFRLPIVRGVVTFVDSLVLGMKTLTYSSSFYEEEEVTKSDKKEKVENVIIVLLSILLAVGFFMLLPFFLSELLRSRIQSQTTLTVIEGGIRIVLFIGYVLAISCMKDIRRVFMYHGAEHKTINCVENGLALTVENVKKQSRHHRRCGTSFLFLVMFISIIFFVFIHIDNIWLRMIFRVLLIPVIAGVSYEFIRLAGNSDNPVVAILSKPGMWLQSLTTREPDADMIEVAIASVEAVFDWKEYQRIARAHAKRVKKGKGTKTAAQQPKKESGKNGKKSRAQQKRELAEREEAYRKRVQERERLLKEEEEKSSELNKKYEEWEKDKEKREKVRANRVIMDRTADPEDISDETLDRLDFYFDQDKKDEEQDKMDEKQDKKEVEHDK